MRKIFLFMNVSVDGYFEGPGHDISAFNAGTEAFDDNNTPVDTLLFGRRTYEHMKAFWPTPQASEMMPELAKFMNDTQKVVASHSGFEPGWKNVQVISGDVVEQVRKLKAQPGETIGIFGSNTLVVSLMEAGLIDEFQIVVNTVALGEGTSLFKGLSKKVPLVLVDTRKFKTGAMMLTYKPG